MRGLSLFVFLCAMHWGGVAVANTKPVADAGTKQKVLPGSPVLLDGSQSFDTDGDSITYSWEQLSGPSIGLGTADFPQLNFTAPDVTVKTRLVFRLTVTDDQGKRGRDRVAVVVDPRGSRPQANAGEDFAVSSGATVILDGSASTDPDNDIERFAWKQLNGVPVDLQDADTVRAVFVAPDVTETTVLRFRLRVFDVRQRHRADFISVTVEPDAGTEAPGQPVDVSVSAGDASLLVSWNAPQTGGLVQSYNICVAESAIADPATCAGGTLLLAQRSEALIEGLTNCTEHFVYVIAVNSAGSNFAASSAEPQAPAGLEYIATTDFFQQAANNRIHNLDLSADGRYVVFDTYSSLVAEDTVANSQDVYLRDRVSNSLTLISVGNVGSGGSKPSISRDGRYIAFESRVAFVANDANNVSDIYVLDRTDGSLTLVSATQNGMAGDAASYEPSIVSHGDSYKLAFISEAEDLTTNTLVTRARQLHIYDDNTGNMKVVIVGGIDGTDRPDLAYDPKMSADGNHVLFNHLIYQGMGTIQTGNGPVSTAFYDTFAYVYDEGAGVSPVSGLQQPLGYQPRATVSGDISADGRYVTFASASSTLVGDDVNAEGDIFLVDRNTGIHTLISRSPLGVVGNEQSGPELAASISDDGRYIAYASIASNLVDGDTNGEWDTFVYDRNLERSYIVSLADNGTQGNDRSAWSVISPDGSVVAFNSEAENLVTGDVNGVTDIFIADSNATGCPVLQ
ncbi:MAG: PKD domain-containing protein [Thiolinea sp.]